MATVKKQLGNMITEILCDALRNAVMITGLVIVMMMIIEFVNVRSAGRWSERLTGSRLRQTLLGALLGLIPGCAGGFAAVSLYTHRVLSFGALVACMLCTCGDESFVMLTLFPHKAVLVFGLLFVISVPFGMLTDTVYDRIQHARHSRHGRCASSRPHLDGCRCSEEEAARISDDCCTHTFELHGDSTEHHISSPLDRESYSVLRRPSAVRILTAAGLVLYAVAIFSGVLEHGHGHEAHSEEHLELLSERWMNLLFGALSLLTALFTLTADEHFIRHHLFGHVIRKHCPRIFIWTFGTLAVIQTALSYADMGSWIGDNIYLVILLAAAIGIIPESGPHLIFVTLFATGTLPFSVLLTSSLSQDGHMSLPLLASTKRGFILAKAINAFIAAGAGILVQFCIC